MSKAPPYSLRRRLLWLLLGTISTLWLSTVIAVFLRAHDMADELFDAQLVQMAKSLLATTAAHPDAEPPALEAAAYGHAQALVFQVWRHDHERHQKRAALLLRSAEAPQSPLTEQSGFSEREWNGALWRFYSRHDENGRYEVQLGQQHDVRIALAGDASWRVLVPLLAGLPLLALAIWFAVGRALRPLRAVTMAVETRRPQALDALAVARTPREVQPLIDALNALFARIRHTLDNERQFTANAAHELRTPLAALKTQAQVALRADADESRKHALAHVVEGVDRMTRMTEQLLTLARLDPEGAALESQAGPPVDLGALATQVVASLRAAANARNIELTVAAQGDARMEGNPELLQILLRNLVDNAIRYTPPNGAVCVSIEDAGDGARLTVSDSGPGIPEAERERALHRFERLGNSRSGGSGLGLSIVARIAELHRATLSLSTATDGGGLSVAIVFPARRP